MAMREFSRRRLLTAGVTGAALIGTGLGARVLAQDSDATPEPQSESEQASATPVTLGSAVPPEFANEANWPVENGDLKSMRQAKGSNISADTIDTLGDAWTMPVDISAPFGALVAGAMIVDGVVYQQDAKSNVYAVKLDTGESVWTNTYDKDVPSGGPNGVAVAYGRVFYTIGGPGDVIAADAGTGEEIWTTNILGPLNEGITMAPLVYDNVVYVSTIPGSPGGFYQGGQRGVIYALDAAKGDVIWYFDTVVDNLWGNARVNSGGGLWHVPSVDEDGQLYVGTGNAAPYPGTKEFPAGSSRPGDNDYADSIIKIDPATGGIVWALNVNPHDLFDLDNQLSPILADVDDVPVAFTSGKHGEVIAVQRDTGDELWRTAVGEHKNDKLTELPDDDYVEVLPGTLGGVETQMAYADGVIYVPVYNLASWYSGSELDASRVDFTTATGEMVAINASTGEIIWDVDLPSGPLAGATVVNDLVFTSALDGVVRAFQVEDGSQVWSYQATAGVNAQLSISGDYLLIPAGGPLSPSEDTWDPAPKPAAQLIALKLGGEVQQQPEGGAATPESGQASPAASASGTVEVACVDIAFDPKEMSIPADTDVQVHVTNKGALQHDWTVEKTDIGTDLLDGGTDTTITVNLPAGTYTYYCTVPGHREAGMVGTLTVG